MTVFYISPTGSGSHSGSSVANAATLKDLPWLVKTAGAGDEVRLLADRGSYKVTTQITLTDGGAAGAPVTIRGASSSGVPMKATIVGTRAAGWKPGLSQGTELFRLLSGANHLSFSDLAVQNVGNGVFRIGANIDDLSIKRVAASNVMRFIENQASGTATTASVNGLTVEDATVSGYSGDAIRVQYNGRNVTLRNVVVDSMKQNGGLYVHGINLRGTVHDVLLDRVTAKNNYGQGSSASYWNGDGFLAEGGVYNLTFRDTMSSGNTDAGYDLKANNVTMIRAQAVGNSKNFRFWGDNVKVIDSTSIDPRYFGGKNNPTHVHTAGDQGATVAFDNFRYSNNPGVKVFDLANGGATITLAHMAMPSSSLILGGGGSTIKTVSGGVTVSASSIAKPLVAASGINTLAGGATAPDASHTQQLVQAMSSFSTSPAAPLSVSGMQAQTAEAAALAANAQHG